MARVRSMALRVSSIGLLGSMAAGLAACEAAAPEPVPTPSASTSIPPDPVALRVGVWGAESEVAAYRAAVEGYDDATPAVEIEVLAYPDAEGLMEAVRAGTVPDVFLADRDDLPFLLAEEVTQPIGERLDERDVDFGDDYSRAALEAFSFERDLQCMPYGIDPDVVYYNTALVDFERMERRGLPVPEFEPGARVRWDLEQFEAAARFATRPRRDSRGFYVEPTLRGISPFLLSAGGEVYDDQVAPTSLAFSSDSSRSALEEVLPILRTAPLTLTDAQVREADPLEWFVDGKLGMIVGGRSLTPLLREVEDLEFGVMPIPGSSTTVGRITGLCISAATREIAAASDLLVHLISGDAVRQVVPSGYLVPANQTVALTEDFQQTDRLPRRADVFTDSVARLHVPPLIADVDALRAVVDPSIALLLNVGVADIEALTTIVDSASRSVLGVEPEPSEEPEPAEPEPAE